MPRTKGSKNKKVKTVTKVTKCNCPPGFECKPKPKKKDNYSCKNKNSTIETTNKHNGRIKIIISKSRISPKRSNR